MKKFMDWLSNSFAPSMNRICSKPWIARSFIFYAKGNTIYLNRFSNLFL